MNMLQRKKISWKLLIIGGFLFGAITMNRFDTFVYTHTFEFRSPIVLSEKKVAPVVMAQAVATPSAQPTVEPTPTVTPKKF